MAKVIIAGVDMVKFVKPGSQEPYRVMAANAIRGAVKDAGIDPRLIEQAYAAYIYGDTTCGQHAFYDVISNRHSGHQCQQRLRQWLHCPVPGAPGRKIRGGGVCAGVWLRGDAARCAETRSTRTGNSRLIASTGRSTISATLPHPWPYAASAQRVIIT